MVKFIIATLVCSAISSVTYRAGGMGKEVKHWIPVWLRHSWVRDWLCPACVIIPLLIISPSWWYLLAYVLLGAALSTYWDWI